MKKLIKKLFKMIAAVIVLIVAAIVLIVILHEPPNYYNDELNKGLEADENGEYETAMEYYTIACNGHNFTACVNIGISYERGRGVDTDYAKAAEYYEKACEGRIGNNRRVACTYAGYIYYRGGFGIEQNYAKAAEYWQPECGDDQYNVWACAGLGKLYENGYGVSLNTAKALDYYGAACLQYNEEACEDFKRLEKSVKEQR